MTKEEATEVLNKPLDLFGDVTASITRRKVARIELQKIALIEGGAKPGNIRIRMNFGTGAGMEAYDAGDQE